MASHRVLEVLMRRHVFDSEQPFASVLDGIFGGISQPGIGQLFSKLAVSTSYEQVSTLVRQAQGSVGLMRFLQLDLDSALTLDPQAPDWTGRRLVRLIAGNPVTMGQMTRHVADAGSYAPVTILIQERLTAIAADAAGYPPRSPRRSKRIDCRRPPDFGREASGAALWRYPPYTVLPGRFTNEGTHHDY
jgi:hypothetical protein